MSEICPNFQPRDDSYLLSPSLRLDDITEFIERITTMKQMPTNGLVVKPHKQTDSQRGSTTSRGSNEAVLDENREPSGCMTMRQRYKCSTCGIVQSNASECYSCHKSQLITQMATRLDSSQDTIADDSPRPRTDCFVKPICSMLGRSNRSETISSCRKIHRDGLNSVGLSLTKESWTPIAILPPNPKPFPTPRPRRSSGNLGAVNGGSWKWVNCEQKNDASISRCVTCKMGGCANEHIDSRQRSRTKGEVPQDRNALARQHKYDANELYRKCVTIACCGVLAGMVRRDPLGLFAKPVPADVEEYHQEIKDPIDCSTLRQRILTSKYSSLGSFIADARRLW